MAKGETQACDEGAVASLLDDLAERIVIGHPEARSLVLVGIRSRGVPLAERLARPSGAAVGEPVQVGAVDITLYRDDLGKGDRWPVLKGTDIPFGVDGAEVILVDDVLYTGRTVRAAMNCVCDLGRPAAVKLAILVDRGGRELPIQADYAGITLDVRPGERVKVRLRPTDPADEVVLIASS